MAVSLGQTVDLLLRMEVGGLSETVLVTGLTPIIDTSTATIGAVLDTDALRNIPVGRTFAQALYMSRKTASVHVSRILTKLGVATRGEAAALAWQHGLADLEVTAGPAAK